MFSPDGSTYAISGDGVYLTQEGLEESRQRILNLRDGASLLYSLDQRFIAAGSVRDNDGGIFAFGTDTTGNLYGIREPVLNYRFLRGVFSPDSKLFVLITDEDPYTAVFDTENWQQHYNFMDSTAGIDDFKFSPDGQIIAARYYNACMLFAVAGSPWSIRSGLATNPDNNRLTIVYDAQINQVNDKPTLQYRVAGGEDGLVWSNADSYINPQIPEVMNSDS